MHSLLEFDKEEDMTVNTSKVLFIKQQRICLMLRTFQRLGQQLRRPGVNSMTYVLKASQFCLDPSKFLRAPTALSTSLSICQLTEKHLI